MTKKTQSPFLYSDESLAYFVDVEYTGISIYSLLYDSPDIVATYEKRAYIRVEDAIKWYLQEATYYPAESSIHRFYTTAASEFQRILGELSWGGKGYFSDNFVVAFVKWRESIGDKKSSRALREANPHLFPPQPNLKKQEKKSTAKPRKKKRYVYFFQGADTGRIKIGISDNPQSRLKSLQSSEKLTILKQIEGGEQVERQLHSKFKHLRLHGEWFEGSDELLEYIETL